VENFCVLIYCRHKDWEARKYAYSIRGIWGAVRQTSVQCTLYRLERRCMELVLGPCAILLADAVLVLVVVVNEMKNKR
jgi:hypothetical protein